MKKLLFQNPIFNPTLNLTIKLGFNYEDVKITDRVLICDSKDEKTPLFEAEIVAKAYIPYCLIPEQWLQYEHNPECNTFYSLNTTLYKIYGKNPDLQDIVTCLFFKRI